MLRDDLERVHSEIFREDPYALRFRAGGWKVILLPFQGNFDEREFRAIQEAASVTGDSEMVVTDVESVPPHQETEIIPIDFLAYTEARSGAKAALYLHAFPPSGRWGIIVTCDDVTIVGGEPEPMEALTNALGGTESVKSRFAEECQGDWFEQDHSLELLREIGWAELVSSRMGARR